jgi:predicted ATPase
MSENFIVITGGPGSGKTTLVERLRGRGYPTVGEAGRAIIRDQVAIGGIAHHTADWAVGAEVLLAWEMRSYREAAATASERAARDGGPVFFDRGIPDLVGYHPMMGGRTPPHFVAAAERFRYRRRVFVAPPWPDIYVNDAERKQDFAEAIRSYDAVVDAYESCGYELVTLPKSTVDDRADFVLDRLS